MYLPGLVSAKWKPTSSRLSFKARRGTTQLCFETKYLVRQVRGLQTRNVG